MKLTQLIQTITESSNYTKTIRIPNGYIKYSWKSDLEDEEYEGYIPQGYNKTVLELQEISVDDPGKGHGEKLMKRFLECEDFKKAELIFLDCVPNVGFNFESNLDDAEQIEKQKKFYSRFGFRFRTEFDNRMWLVKKGSIPDSELPT